MTQADQDEIDPPATRLIEDESTSQSFTNFAMAALAAGGALAIVMYLGFPLNLDVNDSEFNPVVFLAAALCLVSAGFAFTAVRDRLRGDTFGKSVLEMRGHCLVPGEVLEGVVRSSQELRPSGNYALCFRCTETVSYQESGKTRHRNRVLWEGHATIEAQDVSLVDGIPVNFSIPRRCRDFWKSAHANNISWALEVNAPVEGLDYYAIFPVPVWPKAPTEDEADE